MCYSKEVTFAVGTIMVAGSTYVWQTYIRNRKSSPLTPVFKNILFGYLLVAVHQFADSLSIVFESQLIFKIGLIASVSCMYFYMRSLEYLGGINFGSLIYAVLIFLCGIEILSADISFENLGFWVRGGPEGVYLLWLILWLSLFSYWNVCILYLRSLSNSSVNRKLLIDYGLYSINFSFILYTLYAYLSLFLNRASSEGLIASWDIYSSFDLVRDSPSIWCVFSMIQIFLIPILFKKMQAGYEIDSDKNMTSLSFTTTLKLLGISLLIISFFIFILPTAAAAALKMVWS